MPVGKRCNRRRLRQQPNDRDVALRLVEYVAGRWIERRQPGDRAVEHRHWMRVVAEALEKLPEVLVHVSMKGDLVHEPVVFLLVRQLAVAKQPGDLEERRILRQLLDGIAAVAEYSLVAIDVGDGTAARCGVQKGRIIAHQTRIVRIVGLDLLELRSSDRTLGDRNLVRLACTGVPDL